ncbi:unannotated protein [freshwater metagenome]|uniref:Unannotated protein n=1 Tax=freshwater metagenome TaxID=449393 RepID=A0A6J7EWR6_9ZZZZ
MNTTLLKILPRLVLWATTSVMAFGAFVLPASSASATVPPVPVPATDNTAQPIDPAQPDPAQADPAQVEIVQSWALAPAGSLDPSQAGNRPELSYSAQPGDLIDDAVTLFNYGNVQMVFRVYATDALNNAEGQFDLLPGDKVPTAAGSWVTVGQEKIVVPAGKQVTIPVKIAIPADAAPGDHVGAILASNSSPSIGESGQTVNLDRRTGTRLYIRVGGALAPELAVADVLTTYHQALNPLGGSATVTYRVENRGNVRLGGHVTGTVAGPLGLGRRTITLPDIPELLPGSALTVTARVADVSALMVAFTAISITPTGAADLGTITGSNGTDTTFAPPLALLLALLALVFGLLAWRAVQRHRAADLSLRTAAPDISQPGRESEPQPA